MNNVLFLWPQTFINDFMLTLDFVTYCSAYYYFMTRLHKIQKRQEGHLSQKRCSTWFIWYQSSEIPATLLETSYSLWLSLKAISRKTKCVSRNMLRGPLNYTFFRLDYRPKIYFVDQHLATNVHKILIHFWSSLRLW